MEWAQTGDPRDSHVGEAEPRSHLRRLPSVERLASALVDLPPLLARQAARAEIAAARERILAGDEVNVERLRESARSRAAEMARPSIRPVINATGVVLHTNLGRAPLALEAAEAAARIGASYSNLEYDLATGERRSRQRHLGSLLRDLTGAEAALAVNNNAAAVLLALAALAEGREAILSRGQLIEIGDSFRIPDVLRQSGAKLVEVGTTNRTRLADYEAAITPDTAVLMRVHQSNFRTVGFAEEVSLGELCELARKRGLAVIDDLGSGALHAIGDEPLLRASAEAGADLVACSADKLLGGPQAGILVGRRDAVERCRRHPLARAVRLDKLQLAALEATLRLLRDAGPNAIPAIAMLDQDPSRLEARARAIADVVGDGATVEVATSRPGGGALPLVELEGPVCAIDPGPLGAEVLSSRLRLQGVAVVARIQRDRVILDPRTMSDEEALLAGEAVRGAIRPR